MKALADWAHLFSSKVLPMLNSTSAGTFKIVTFGGSYGGQLAAWLRLKYRFFSYFDLA